MLQAIRLGQVDLNDPAVTLALLDLNAVVGVTGHRGADGRLSSVGIQCSLCHSTVDDSFAPGIGHRLDGWPNRDLNVGAIVALAPDLSVVANLLQTDQQTVRAGAEQLGAGQVRRGAVPGREGLPPGREERGHAHPGGVRARRREPAHLHRAGAACSHWNAFVANLEMHGKGTFIDARLDDPLRFPIAARAGFGHVQADPDLITSKLPALQYYQLSIPAPVPSHGSYDAVAAEAGKAVFNGAGRCSTCHVPPIFTEPGWNMHTAAEIGIDDFQANRGPDQRYRTTPLAGLFARQKGGFYHDGRFADLRAVVEHYNQAFGLGLSEQAKKNLVEYLKSL